VRPVCLPAQAVEARLRAPAVDEGVTGALDGW
jgi:hypothetical protein